MSEPDWTKQIPSGWLCDWFYFFFVLRVILFGLILGLVVYIFLSAKKSIFGPEMIGKMLGGLIGLTIAGTEALFLYLICSRSLQPAN